MKKVRLILLILSLILACSLIFVACDEKNASDNAADKDDATIPDDENSKEDHIHSFGEWSVKREATCTADGEMERVCECGAKETKKIDAHGHTEAIDEAIPPSCLQAGLSEGKYCSECNKTLVRQEVLVPSGHSWDEGRVTREPTETTAGERLFTCTVCKETKTENISALEHTHDYKTTVIAPTCEERGYTTYSCRCGDSYEDDFVDATGHTEVIDSAKKPTCTEDGLTEGKHCSKCKKVLIAQEGIGSTGHTDGEWIVDKKPTATQSGKKHQICAVCKETIAEETIPATPPQEIFYTVYFKDHDGTVLKTVLNVKEGSAVSAPADPYREGYRFIGWDKSFTSVRSNLTVTAKYEAITSASLVVESVNVNKGDKTVELKIFLLNNPGITALKFDISYESSLTLTQVIFNPDFGSYVTAPEPYTNPQTVSLISPSSDIDVSGTLVTLKFRVADTVSSGDSIRIDLKIDERNTFNGNFDKVQIGVVGGNINIT